MFLVQGLLKNKSMQLFPLADGRVLVWDSSQRGSSCVVCGGGGGEVLACDWSKYDHHSLVTAGTDACIK